MSKVHIVTDSNAFLPPDLRKAHNIQVIPHRIKLAGERFEEGDNFSCEDLFIRTQEMHADGATRFPEVEAADLNTILDSYQNLGNDAEEIVSIHMSSHLSPMWEHARRAAELLKGRYTIRVIDSLSTSFGLGLLVRKAAEAAEQGASVHEIARIVNGAVPHLYLTTFSESLNYLERSTQLSASQSVLGTMLGIKAMLIMEDGKLLPLEKVQTREEVLEKLSEFVLEFANVEEVGVIQHGYTSAQDELIDMLREEERLAEIPIHSLSYPPSLAVYMGPEIIGVMVYEGVC